MLEREHLKAITQSLLKHKIMQIFMKFLFLVSNFLIVLIKILLSLIKTMREISIKISQPFSIFTIGFGAVPIPVPVANIPTANCEVSVSPVITALPLVVVPVCAFVTFIDNSVKLKN
jgi:hypothetical protein